MTAEIIIEQRAIQERNELRLLQHALAAPALSALHDRAETENNKRTLFQALITADLRAPLTALASYIDWLLAAAEHPLPPAQQAALVKMQDYAGEIAAIVDDLLKAERAERGLFSLPMGAFDLNVVAEWAHVASRPLAEAKGVRLEMTLRPLPTAFRLAHLLYEAVIELSHNAISYNRQGGEVHLLHTGLPMEPS